MTGLTEDEAVAYVATLVDTVPDSPAPLTALATGGEAARHRHRRTALGAAAAVLAVVVGTSVAVGLTRVGRDGTGPAEDLGPTQLSLRYEDRWVGLGPLVMQVPQQWAVLGPCPGSDAALTMSSGDGCDTVAVVVAPLDSDEGREIAASSRGTATNPHGVGLTALHATCDFPSDDASARDSTHCTASIVVAEAATALRITTLGEAEIEKVLDSIRVLPAGRALVPDVDDLLPTRQAVLLLDAMGLGSEDVDATAGTFVRSVTPTPGSVVEAGTSVGLTTTPDGPVDLAGYWRLDTPGVDDDPIQLRLVPNGDLVGTEGCGTFTGTWSVDGAHVSFATDLAARTNGCDVRRLAAQLGTVRTARHTMAGAELLDEVGNVVALLVRED